MDAASLILVLVVGTTIWVYADAKGRDWRGTSTTLDGATSWAGLCLLMWIVFFPMYLAQRGRAPRRHGMQAGWYADPHIAGAHRWWDGRHWTAHIQPPPPPVDRGSTPPQGFPVVRH